jgi:flagellar basal-body rod protein FlgC
MKFFADLKVSASGMEAERKRMDVISENIANINTAHIAGQEPYKAQRLITSPGSSRFGEFLSGFRVTPSAGIEVLGVAREETPSRQVFEPGHPLADANGYVSYPDINIIEEMVQSVTAYRSYEANLTAFNETKRMLSKAMEMGK